MPDARLAQRHARAQRLAAERARARAKEDDLAAAAQAFFETRAAAVAEGGAKEPSAAELSRVEREAELLAQPADH